MASLLVRNLDEKIIRRLKENARRNGRSLQGEAKEILTNGAKLTAVETLEMLQEWKKRFKGRKFSDSTAMIRKDRDSR